MVAKTQLPRSSRTESRQQLIIEYLGVAKSVALQVHSKLPAHVDIGDLIHAGILGLMDAADKYDPSRQVQFSSYAKYRIRGAILDSLRKLDFTSRDLRRSFKKVESATQDLRAVLQREPTEEEIAERMSIDIDQLRKIVREVHRSNPVSTSYSFPRESGVMEHDFEGRTEARPDHIFSQVQIRAVLNRAMKPLRPRQQQVVYAYYSEHKTMKEIATCMGVNESRVCQLHKAALAKMQIELRAIGVDSCAAALLTI
jgi:RNA polymerase sigma factor for flagellar operon FliA